MPLAPATGQVQPAYKEARASRDDTRSPISSTNMRQLVTLAVAAVLAACLQLSAPAPAPAPAPALAYYSPALPPSASVLLVPQGSTANLASVASGVPYVYVGGPGSLSGYVLREGAESKPEEGAESKPEEGASKPDEGIGFWGTLGSYVPNIPFINPAPAKPEETKPVESPDAAPAKLEDLDEGVQSPKPGQKFVLLGQPQFFGNYGNYDLIRRLGIQNIGTGGGVLIGGTPHLGGKPQPEKVQVPALSGFQRYSQQGFRDNTESSTVEVPSSSEGTGSEDTDAVVGADPPGPSVAQVKPQAIALAGPGGVAAAAPVGTAVVGPGGLAVSSPSATAVAGGSAGGGPGGIAVAPASSQAYKQYLMGLRPQKGAYLAYNA